MHEEYPMRINKYLAHQGVATRRDADALIERGLVTINGRIAVLGDKVKEGDQVEMKGVRKKAYIYYAYHKPAGIVTHSPKRGEKGIAHVAHLPKGVFPVGRLDKASHGLMILTNDGRVTDRLLSPAYEHDKEYRVTVREPLMRGFKARFERGLLIEGELTKPAIVRELGEKSFTIVLTEGKKHQIRRMVSAIGNVVTELCRTRILTVRLGDLKEGELRALTGVELARFLTALGLRSD